ncbi:RHS repeat-associated core domain-containing protein [Burkholderia ubonensis]|uniref:RHS repeat-associated core domain-containing protein n=1 Tax=Burkholderia ubonensis TaxID=101571 RepID=UPI0008FE8690|nr:RHS repeat-associated core domain-containing protein [Burkholderia ubonensis]
MFLKTGLHYIRHWYYDPHSGRFISRDLIGLVGGINSYIYVHNPFIRRDPLGLQATGVDVRLVSRFKPADRAPDCRDELRTVY